MTKREVQLVMSGVVAIIAIYVIALKVIENKKVPGYIIYIPKGKSITAEISFNSKDGENLKNNEEYKVIDFIENKNIKTKDKLIFGNRIDIYLDENDEKIKDMKEYKIYYRFKKGLKTLFIVRK